VALVGPGAAGLDVLDVLAGPGSARAELYQLAARFSLDPVFPDAVEAEAAALLAAPGLDDAALEDLTALPFVTIDNADSRDLDQALHIGRRAGAEGDGPDGWRVSYALADAAFYVRPSTALFAEALSRGASYYLPGLSIPMLPRALSEGLVSLNPEVPRRALVLQHEIDASGHGVATRVVRAHIRSRAKLSYDAVQAFYDAPAGHPLSGQEYTESLELLRDVGRQRILEAEARDVVRYERVDVGVGFEDPDGRRFFAVADSRNDTERYNEQLSLLTNSEGARWLADGVPEHVQAIFRVHPSPPPERLAELARRIDALVAIHGLAPATWRWRRGREALATYLRRLPSRGPQARVAQAIQRQAVVVNLRSTFTEEPGPHHGVGADVYMRLSSPMREIVGVFTHKEIYDRLVGPGAGGTAEADAALREQVIAAANAAKNTQRTLTRAANKLVLDALFRQEMAAAVADRPAHTGTVMGCSDAKLYVQLDEPPLEVKVYLRDLSRALGAPAELVRGGAGLRVGDRRFDVGGAITLRVADYDRRHDRWRLAPVAG
jgi:ribonuclease R